MKWLNVEQAKEYTGFNKTVFKLYEDHGLIKSHHVAGYVREKYSTKELDELHERILVYDELNVEQKYKSDPKLYDLNAKIRHQQKKVS